jgi:hypothetical protein
MPVAEKKMMSFLTAGRSSHATKYYCSVIVFWWITTERLLFIEDNATE